MWQHLTSPGRNKPSNLLFRHPWALILAAIITALSAFGGSWGVALGQTVPAFRTAPYLVTASPPAAAPQPLGTPALEEEQIAAVPSDEALDLYDNANDAVRTNDSDSGQGFPVLFHWNSLSAADFEETLPDADAESESDLTGTLDTAAGEVLGASPEEAFDADVPE